MSKTTNTPKAAPQPTAAPQQKQLPTVVTARINAVHPSGPVLATASINLNGCFAIRGVKIIAGENGPFVSMPSYKAGNGYKDVCFPCTKEFHDQFQMVVLDAYQQELVQIQQRGQTTENQTQGGQEAPVPPFPEMAM